MRISKAQLQDIINEEIASALLSTENLRLTEARSPGGVLYKVDAASLITFAKAYASLGLAVQEQLDDLVEFQEGADINHNAFDVMERALRGMNRELDEAMDAWHQGIEDALSDDEDADELGVSYEPPRRRKLR